MQNLAAEINTPWLIVQRKSPQVKIRLFCFHYGGGSASVYRQWAKYLSPSIELASVQLPGREGRFQESYLTSFEALTKALIESLKPFLDKPFVVFGHSLGAIKSFEWIRKLKELGLPQPELYIPSGMPAPHLYKEEFPISTLPEEEFVQELLNEYGETLGTVLENKDLRAVFIPQLRADFELLENYKYHQGPALDCPILAFAGEDETEIEEKALAAWGEQTNGGFQQQRFPGDHFFIHSSEQEVLSRIDQELSNLLQQNRVPDQASSFQ